MREWKACLPDLSKPSPRIVPNSRGLSLRQDRLLPRPSATSMHRCFHRARIVGLVGLTKKTENREGRCSIILRREHFYLFCPSGQTMHSGTKYTEVM